jgi:hypothetical protein
VEEKQLTSWPAAQLKKPVLLVYKNHHHICHSINDLIMILATDTFPVPS